MLDTIRAGVMRRPVFRLMLVAIITIASACYSTSYRKQVSANTDLIAGLADKLLDYCRAGFVINGQQISSEEMGEFYYALKKARGFSDAEHAQVNRVSYLEFITMLQKYAAFVHSADEYRLSGHADEQKLSALITQHDAVEETAAEVRTELARED